MSRYAIPELQITCIVVVVGILCWSPAEAQAPRSAGEERSVQAELIRRIRLVAAYLGAEAQHASVAALELSRVQGLDAVEVLAAASRQQSVLAQDAGRRARARLTESRPAVSAAGQQQAIVAELTAGAQRLRGYAEHVHGMSVQLATANARDIMGALRTTAVPREATVAMASLGGPDPSSGRSGLEPFVVGPGSSATVDYPAVGVVVAKDSSLGNVPVCTGTLVAPRVVLTAAHCRGYRLVGVFFQHAGFFDLDRPLIPHPEFRFPDADIAVLVLRTAVDGIKPAPLNESKPVSLGTLSRIVGFGYRNVLSGDGQSVPSSSVLRRTGLKLHARVVTEGCDSRLRSDRLICWTYKESGIDGALGSTCHGDSGGPLFAHDGGQWVLAGVTTAGTTCHVGDRALDAEVFRFVGWIRSHIARNPPNTSAGMGHTKDVLDPLDNPDRYVFESRYSRFGDTPPEWRRDFKVSAGVGMLRIGVIGTPSGQPLRLELGQKAAATPSCVQTANATMQSCEVLAPTAGEWMVKVIGLMGTEFQSVAIDRKP